MIKQLTILSAVAFFFLFVAWAVTPVRADCPHHENFNHKHCDNNLEAQVADHEARLGTLEGQNLDSRLGTLESQNLDSRVGTIEGQNLDGRLTTIEGQNLNSRVGTIEGQNLDSRVGTIEGQNLNSRLGTIEAQNLDSRVSDLEALVDSGSGGGGLFTPGGSVANGQVMYSNSLRPGPEDNEVAAQFPIPRDGELFALAVWPRVNTLTGIATFTVRLNGADTNLQINVPAGSTAVHTIESVVNVSAGDLVALEIDTEAGEGNITFVATYEYR